MEFKVGTPLIEVLNAFELNETKDEFKAKIMNFCKEELAHGDSIISNEIEASIINSWFNNSNDIELPNISNNYNLSDSYSFKEGTNTKVFEEYQDERNCYYIKCTTKDINDKLIKSQLTYRSKSLKDYLTSGGVEDTLFDNNIDGYASSRVLVRSNYIDGVKNVELYSDINLDGEFD